MKKIKILLTIFIALLSLCVLIGCPNGDDIIPDNMVFTDNPDDPDDPVKEFTIDSNFGFVVRFIRPSEMEMGYTLQAGDTVRGKITETDTKWNTDFLGQAVDMTSSNELIDGALGALPPIAISLKYIKADNVINAVTLEFPGGGIALQAQTLMGATYYRK